MVYDRNSRGDGPIDQGDGRYYGAGGDRSYSGAQDYGAADGYGRGGADRGASERGGWGQREYGNQGYRRYDQPSGAGRGQQDYSRQDGSRRDGGRQQGGRQEFGWQSQGRDDRGGGREWHGSYGSDGRHFEDVGRYRRADDDDRGGRVQRDRGGYARQPQGGDDDRGFLQRAGDEVRSWFGDEEAERRREADARYEEQGDRSGGGRHDDDYRQWRDSQVSQLDRDYHEYRQENRAKFEHEFTSWRTARQGQRDQLRQIKEHAEVVGSDGQHVGTVDKTHDDRILLTKTDAEAGGRHHSIPSRWIVTVDDKTVTLSKTAAEAKAAWEDEDRNSALFRYGDNQKAGQRYDGDDATGGGRDAQGRMLNRSFSGTY